MDQISNILCSVVDLAEFVRNAHPSEEYVAAAHRSYSMIASFMQLLNTNERFPLILRNLIAKDAASKILTEEELSVAKLFLYDFDASGPPKERERYVKLNEDIGQLGYEFIQNAGEWPPLQFDSPQELQGQFQSLSVPSLPFTNSESLSLLFLPLPSSDSFCCGDDQQC